MTTLATHELTAEYPDRKRRALDRVTLEVPDGKTLAVVGPSGAGKTTLLRCIAGLIRPHSGDVRFAGKSVLRMSPQERRIALVFQDDALFAGMTVRDNLRFAFRPGPPQTGARMLETAGALHVDNLLDRRPRELSGGERQRASIARALLSDPVALLLDEPLAHLDPSLRRSVLDEVVGVRERFGGPIVYVTHDHTEAMSVGDELAVLIDGRIEDRGDPQRVYDAPGTLTVARFLGDRPMNLFDDGPVVGIRPEHVRIVTGDGEGGVRGRITRRESSGADAYLHVDTPRGPLLVRVSSTHPVRPNDAVVLDFPAQHVRRFDPVSGVAIA